MSNELEPPIDEAFAHALYLQRQQGNQLTVEALASTLGITDRVLSHLDSFAGALTTDSRFLASSSSSGTEFVLHRLADWLVRVLWILSRVTLAANRALERGDLVGGGDLLGEAAGQLQHVGGTLGFSLPKLSQVATPPNACLIFNLRFLGVTVRFMQENGIPGIERLGSDPNISEM
ncbi:hypothetical protein T439DRAFT_329145 [Meredithblackwellia eburnea MCA 4105]